MGSFAHLMTCNTKSYSEYLKYNGLDNPSQRGQSYLLSKYTIPPFWLALFDEKDLHVERVQEIEDDEVIIYHTCYFLTKKEKAIHNFKINMPTLKQLFGEEYEPFAYQFLDYLSAGLGKYLFIDTEELRSIDDIDIDYFKSELIYALRTVTQPSSDLIMGLSPHEKHGIGDYIGYRNLAPSQVHEFVGSSNGDAPWDKREILPNNDLPAEVHNTPKSNKGILDIILNLFGIR